MAYENSGNKPKYQEIHPKGIYEVEITGQAMAETKAREAKGDLPATASKPYLKLKVKVLALKKADNGQKPTIILNGTRFIDLYFTEKTIERTKKLITAAGFKGKSLLQLNPDHPQHSSLVGFKFDASNTPEQYKDSKTNSMKWQDKFSALPIGERDSNAWMSKINTANSTRVMALDALFNSTKVDMAQVAPAAAPAPAQQQAAQQEDPFAGQTNDAPEVPWEPEGPSDSDAGAFNW